MWLLSSASVSPWRSKWLPAWKEDQEWLSLHCKKKKAKCIQHVRLFRRCVSPLSEWCGCPGQGKCWGRGQRGHWDTSLPGSGRRLDWPPVPGHLQRPPEDACKCYQWETANGRQWRIVTGGLFTWRAAERPRQRCCLFPTSRRSRRSRPCTDFRWTLHLWKESMRTNKMKTLASFWTLQNSGISE